MSPKFLRRLRRAGATWFGFDCSSLVAVLALACAPCVAQADAGAVPIVEASAPRVTVGVAARTSIAASGGSKPYAFEVVAGALPTGLTLARDGTISGTATQGGPFRFTVRVTDSASLPATVLQSYVMVVDERVDPTLDPNTIALLTQQASDVRRFALAQIANVQARLQALRSDSAGRCAGENKRPSLAAPAATRSNPKNNTLFEQQPPPDDPSFSMPLDNCRTLPDRTTTLWTAGALNVGAASAQADANAPRFGSQGLTLGGDYGLLPNLAVGAGIGFARDDGQVAPVGALASGAYGTSLSGYLSYRPVDRFYVEAMFGVGDVIIDSTRVTGSGGEAYATRRAEQRFISLSAGQRFNAAGWELVPYTRIDHVRATLRALNEAGAGTDALSLADERVPSLKLVGGATAATSFATPLGTLAPRTSFEYRREMERSDTASLRYSDDPNGPLYSLVGSGSERDSATLGLGASLSLVSRWNMGVGWTINRSLNSNSNRIDATLSKVF